MSKKTKKKQPKSKQKKTEILEEMYAEESQDKFEKKEVKKQKRKLEDLHVRPLAERPAAETIAKMSVPMEGGEQEVDFESQGLKTPPLTTGVGRQSHLLRGEEEMKEIEAMDYSEDIVDEAEGEVEDEGVEDEEITGDEVDERDEEEFEVASPATRRGGGSDEESEGEKTPLLVREEGDELYRPDQNQGRAWLIITVLIILLLIVAALGAGFIVFL